MPRNKPRLQLALYARPKHPGTYHYALFVASKTATGPVTKHHVKNTLQTDSSGEAKQPWRYEGILVPIIEAEHRLLARIIIGKVAESPDHVQQILESLPVQQGDDSFTCRTWVRDGFQALKREGVVTTNLQDWDEVERKSLEYLERKRKQRRWSGSWHGGSKLPVMDLIKSKEVFE